MMETRAEIYVSGRVQMIGFRAFTVRHATILGLTGYVCNLSDGRVHVVVEGEKDRVNELIALLRRGPPGAYVQDVKVKMGTPTGEFTTFGTRY
ncbi:MAG: acylphosphatase [Methanosarcinales archaeon Met12]|nr:MAG: acylphosphatase [Methanosarcinales archaeon Met12]